MTLQYTDMDYKFISIKVLIDRIMERPLFTTLKFDSAVRWTVWVLHAIDNPEFFFKKIETIYIDSYRGEIPYDFIKCEKTEVIENTLTPNSSLRVSMRTSGDPFLKDKVNRVNTANNLYQEFTYTIEGNYIFTDFEEGKLQMAYWALPIDTNGYIMIPDNPKVVQAVMSYIKYKHLEILNDVGQVEYNKVAKEEQDYLFYVAAAQSEHFMSNLDTVEQMLNIQSQLFPSRLQHQNGYKNLGEKEFRRKR